MKHKNADRKNATMNDVINGRKIQLYAVKMSFDDYNEQICNGTITNGRSVRYDWNFRTKKATVWLTEKEKKAFEKYRKQKAVRV